MKKIEKTVNSIYTLCYQDEKISISGKLIAVILIVATLITPITLLLGFTHS